MVYRKRVSADVPELTEVLAEQQSGSRYPFRWPLQFPTEDFIVRSNELASWTAQVNRRPAGHVCVQSVRGSATSNGVAEADLVDLWSRGHNRPAGELAAVSSLFVATKLRRLGIGLRLLETATDWILGRGLAPCLDVLQAPSPAASIYVSHGWRTVGELRPSWLPKGHPPLLAMIYPTA